MEGGAAPARGAARPGRARHDRAGGGDRRLCRAHQAHHRPGGRASGGGGRGRIQCAALCLHPRARHHRCGRPVGPGHVCPAPALQPHRAGGGGEPAGAHVRRRARRALPRSGGRGDGRVGVALYLGRHSPVGGAHQGGDQPGARPAHGCLPPGHHAVAGACADALAGAGLPGRLLARDTPVPAPARARPRRAGQGGRHHPGTHRVPARCAPRQDLPIGAPRGRAAGAELPGAYPAPAAARFRPGGGGSHLGGRGRGSARGAVRLWHLARGERGQHGGRHCGRAGRAARRSPPPARARHAGHGLRRGTGESRAHLPGHRPPAGAGRGHGGARPGNGGSGLGGYLRGCPPHLSRRHTGPARHRPPHHARRARGAGGAERGRQEHLARPRAAPVRSYAGRGARGRA